MTREDHELRVAECVSDLRGKRIREQGLANELAEARQETVLAARRLIAAREELARYLLEGLKDG